MAKPKPAFPNVCECGHDILDHQMTPSLFVPLEKCGFPYGWFGRHCPCERFRPQTRKHALPLDESPLDAVRKLPLGWKGDLRIRSEVVTAGVLREFFGKPRPAHIYRHSGIVKGSTT